MVAILLLIALAALAKADTPANCSNTEAPGVWKFYLGSNIYNNSIDCSTFSLYEAQSIAFFTLETPDVAYDENHNRGFWTFIYNQGFELVVNDVKYFAFSNYSAINSTSYVSNCQQTLPGWYHNSDGTQWGCYIGYQLDKNIVNPQTSSVSKVADDADDLYLNEQAMVDEINNSNRKWKAKVHQPFVGKPKSTIRRIAGSSTLNFPENKESNKVVMQSYPTFYDWRNISGVNYVSPVRNQGDCGSCYTFGSTAALEARIRIQTNNQVQVVLSPQEILSCGEYMQGCSGGFPYLVYKYGEDFSLVEDSCFPYAGQDPSSGGPTCNQTCQNPTRWNVTDYQYIGGYYGGCSAQAMMEEIYNYGPISVNFMVLNNFLSYSSGIYDGCSNATTTNGLNFFEAVNHAVMIAGWGTANGTDYWIVKNSWGTDWGIDGYFYIQRGVNECAIESIASRAFPVI